MSTIHTIEHLYLALCSSNSGTSQKSDGSVLRAHFPPDCAQVDIRLKAIPVQRNLYSYSNRSGKEERATSAAKCLMTDGEEGAEVEGGGRDAAGSLIR
ncbi:hypothetical protein TYRP_007896 [Tyrophagus putrescentiae]|nr:hypothetical protein TYRP_007896 [Tyrophagus putrescentiae]